MTRIKIAFQWLFDRLKKIRGEGFNALLTILILAGQTYILLKQTSYTREQATASRNDDRQKIYEQLSKLGPISEKALAYGYVFHEISLKRICEGACSKELVTKASLALDKEKISDLTPENYQDRSISYRSTDVAAQQLFFLYNLFKVVMPRQYDPYVSPLPEPLSDLKLLLKESELRCNTDPDDLRSFSQTIQILVFG